MFLRMLSPVEHNAMVTINEEENRSSEKVYWYGSQIITLYSKVKQLHVHDTLYSVLKEYFLF